MILVTGSTGNVGTQLVKELVARYTPFRALVRTNMDAERLRAQGIETIIGDFAEPESLRVALQGIERVFLLCSSGPMQPALEETVVNEAKRAGVRHLVKLSILAADSQSECVFFRWHGQSEEAIQASGLEYTFLRPNSFMQSFVRDFAYSIAQEGEFRVPVADGKISFIDARDIAAVAAIVLRERGHEGRTYDLTGPVALSYADAATLLSVRLGKQVNYISVPANAARQEIWLQGMPLWLVDGLMALFDFARQGKAAVVSPVVKQVTKSNPRTLEAYFHENIQAFQ
jgi:uncharacterized protein YbjT (DUF2867 family)